MGIDLKSWLEERLGSRSEEEGWRIEPLSNGAAKVIGAHGEVTAFVREPSQIPDEGGASTVLVGDEIVDPSIGLIFDSMPADASANRIISAVRNGHELFRLRRLEADHEKNLRKREYEIGQLIEIGKSFGAVRDVDVLLDVILKKARFLAKADAGSIYVVEGDGDDITERKLRFKLSQNDSIQYESREFVMPVSTESIAGAAAIMKQSINIPDVQRIPKEAPYRFDPSWDERTGYITKSTLAVPMINFNGDVLGVVQLINRKKNRSTVLSSRADFEHGVVEMDPRSQELVETLASQAGIAMENVSLYAEIQRIFQGFIFASVHAIEQRDPTTSGHSVRVSALTRRLAEVVRDVEEGTYANADFTDEELKEIEIAALLHDFGKVGVREEVLVKAKKLFPPNLKMIRSRFDYIRRSIENDYLHRRLMMIEQGAPKEELAILDQASERAVEEIEECWRVIWTANEPTVMPEEDFAKIEEISRRSYFDLGGSRQPFLEAEEVKSLKVAKGSLTSEEMEEIRSHVVHTISFLEQIPWGKSLRNVPYFAGAHHEKLDGTGYPHRLKGEQIPLPARIMAVADVFDALTASDRPYKKAVPLDHALQILELEAKSDHIDKELVRLFRESKAYEVLNNENA